jgi:predicted dehydrogenase
MELVAVMDVVEQNREKANEHIPGSRFYGDLESLLAHEKLDFVDICTPPHTHADYIRACARRGIHVLCEKPLTENYESARTLAGDILAAGVVFAPCHQYKYSPLWTSVREVIASGDLGQVTLARFSVFRLQADAGTAAWNPEWRTSKKQSGGGILVDTGAHYFYLARHLFGTPSKISAVLRTLKHHDYGVEDTALVTLDYGKTLVAIELTWAAGQRANSVFIAGTRGSLAYDGTRLLKTDASGTRELPMPDVSDKREYVRWYASLLREFADQVEAKAPNGDLLEESMMVMKMLDLSYRASASGSTLDVA